MKIEAGNNSLEIIIKERSYPDSNDYWGGNWLNACVFLCLDGKQSGYRMFFRTDDFDMLLNRRSKANNDRGIWEFHTMEECLQFSVSVEGEHAKIKGFVRNEPDHDKVRFDFDSGSEEALKFILGANDILDKHPIKKYRLSFCFWRSL